METQTWFLTILIGFAISPTVGYSILSLYVFNYVTAIIFGLYGRYQREGFK